MSNSQFLQESKKKGKTSKEELFKGQRACANFWDGLSDANREKAKQKFDKFIKDNTVSEGKLLCLVLKSGLGKVRGLSDRAGEEGRRQIKPFIFFEGVVPIPIKTSKDNKGPEVNLASFFATTHRMRDHFEKGLVCSHRCHNKKCLNIQHLCWERQDINSDRNTCQAHGKCSHSPSCLVKGPANLRNDDTMVIIDGTPKKAVKRELIVLD